MTNKPVNLTNKHLELVKNTYRIILTDNVITKEEMTYLRKLYWVVYDKDDVKDHIIVQDLSELAGWTIKNVSK